MSDLIDDAAKRSKIMANRSRDRDEMLGLLNQRDDKDKIMEQYQERTKGPNLFDDKTAYMQVPEYVFQNHLNILKELIAG